MTQAATEFITPLTLQVFVKNLSSLRCHDIPAPNKVNH